MSDSRPLYVPVILGTVRKARMSANVARFAVDEVGKRTGVETDLIDIAGLTISTHDAGEESKDPEFSEICNRADAFIIVVPEYNHGYPGLLKHVLDTNLKEYIHKPVGFVGVAAGPFGGTRVIENMLPVMRELGLVTIFWDVNFGHVHKSFDDNGELTDESYVRRFNKFFNELIWMGKVLRLGREQVPIE